MIDIHTHILPNVDDGAVSLEDALAMASQSVGSGIHTVVATPHFNWSGSATIDEIEKVIDVFQDALEYEQIPLKILRGMEIWATDDLPELLSQGKVWTYPGTQYFLVEFHAETENGYFDWLLDRCVAEGFIPVIAHPEQYDAVWRHPEMAREWKNKGYGVQVDRDSLLGGFGQHAYECADFLVKRDWANCIASDAHSPVSRNAKWDEAFDLFSRKYGMRRLEKLLGGLSGKIR